MAAEPNVRDSERFSFGNQDRTVRSPGPFRPENRTFFHRAKERCKERERKKETREQDSAPEPNSDSPSQESANPLVRVMDFYGAFRGSTLKEERTKIFDLELAKAATALLAACGQNADEAIQVIERIGKDLQQEGQPWTLETICRYRRYSALMNSCVLITLAVVWPRLSVTPRAKVIRGLFLFCAFTMSFGGILGAAWGTSWFTPMASAGFHAPLWQEAFIGLLVIVTVSTYIVATSIVVWSLRPSRS